MHHSDLPVGYMGTLGNGAQDQVRIHQCSEIWFWSNGAVEMCYYTVASELICDTRSLVDLGPLWTSSSVTWWWGSLCGCGLCKLWDAAHVKTVTVICWVWVRFLVHGSHTWLVIRILCGSGEGFGKIQISSPTPEMTESEFFWEGREVCIVNRFPR